MQKTNVRTPRGFSLPELLIVVVVISILMLIAIPNFRESQTRSLVARAKSDMKVVAFGLEAYRDDNPGYPAAYAGFNSPINPRFFRLLPITTPVAYIDGLPHDVFSRERPLGFPFSVADSRSFSYIDRDSYGRNVPNAFTGPFALYYPLFGIEYPQAQWLLRSVGPMGLVDLQSNQLGGTISRTDAYDPTNGTISVGNIFMLGRGIGFI